MSEAAIRTVGGVSTNATFYDEVRLDDKWRLGEVDGGWAVMKTALKFERGIAGGQFFSPPLIEDTIEYAREHRRPDGTLLIDDFVQELGTIGVDKAPAVGTVVASPVSRRLAGSLANAESISQPTIAPCPFSATQN